MAAGSVLLTLAYDGTAFAGWQRQPGQRTVQGVLEDAIEAMDGAPHRARGASRTDSGVHAIGQRVAFDAAREIPPYGWVHGLNGKLPDDVAVTAAELRELGYDPRFDAVGKHYRYVIHTGEVRDPLLHNRVWHVGRSLDVEAMHEVAQVLLGRHDFAAFQAANDERENTVRTLTRIDVRGSFAADPRLVSIDVEGTAFLKNMVRILAGTLFEVGRGRFDEERVAALVAEGARRPAAGQTAPPQGLTLVSIALGRHPRSAEER